MSELTPIDRAHAKMEAAPEDDQARLLFYDRLASSELFILLENEAQGDQITPRLFPVEDDTLVLGFDTEARLGEFADGPAPYAALSGRSLAQMLSESRLGLGLNLETAPSAIILPPSAMAWLHQNLQSEAMQMETQPLTFEPPQSLPKILLERLDEKLATASGRADHAYLCFARYADGSSGHLLSITGCAAGAEPALTQITREALTFSGLDAGQLDLAFLAPDDARLLRLEAVALRFDIPFPETPAPRAVPGSNPEKPPKL